MSPAPLSRRTLVAGAGAALVAAALPAVPVAVIPAAAVPATFDPGAFVADLLAAGCNVVAFYPVPRGGEPAGPPGYLIRPPKGRGFGAGYTAVMARWWGAIEACPDHDARVAAHVFGRGGAGAGR